jgi:hypothetical protein
MLWLSLYTAILPAALLAVPLVGDWSLMVGTLVSLPLAPFGFVAFWCSVTVGGKLFAFFFTWLFDFGLAWLLVAQYVGYQRKRGAKVSIVKHVALRTAAALLFVVLVMVALRVYTP